MRNGLLGSLLSLWFAVSLASAQTPPLTPENNCDFPSDSCWQPPRTDLIPRPDCSPGGYRYYGSVDYILWWSERDSSVPPLIPPTAGNITLPETSDFGALLRNGVRGELGMWLNSQQTCGFELGGFWVDNRAPSDTGQAGDVAIASHFHSELWGAQAQLRTELYRGTWMHFDFLTGFRYLSLAEGLNIKERDAAADVDTSDRFATQNRFYGGELGGEIELHYDSYFLDFWGIAALGVNDETFNVNGTTLAAGQATPGGIVVAPGTIGSYHHNEFAVVPAFGVKIGCQFSQHLRATAGYTFIYLSDAVRPGAQADAIIRSPQTTPFPFQSSDFWVQGLNLGLEFRF